MYKTIRLIRVIILLVVMFVLPTTQALAALSRCRVDPHFHLSNGDMVTVTLDIGTDIANISNIHYILHVPAGVMVTKVTYTAKSDKKAINETYIVYQDSPANTYTTETAVTTQTPGLVEVTVFSRANGIKEKAVSGYSGQHLFATLMKP
jgi:hypothetical protein